MVRINEQDFTNKWVIGVASIEVKLEISSFKVMGLSIKVIGRWVYRARNSNFLFCIPKANHRFAGEGIR